jgi:hypothetical protein
MHSPQSGCKSGDSDQGRAEAQEQAQQSSFLFDDDLLSGMTGQPSALSIIPVEGKAEPPPTHPSVLVQVPLFGQVFSASISLHQDHYKKTEVLVVNLII